MSIDELVAVCMSAGVKVAVFQQIDRDLTLARGSFGGTQPQVCVKLQSNNARRVRSHFERLISEDVVKDFTARAMQETETRSRQ